MDAISTAAQGLMNATARFDASARRVAGGDSDLVTEFVGQALDKTAFSANLAVIKTADEMAKRLLDLKV